jgi:hypothetical protein
VRGRYARRAAAQRLDEVLPGRHAVQRLVRIATWGRESGERRAEIVRAEVERDTGAGRAKHVSRVHDVAELESAGTHKQVVHIVVKGRRDDEIDLPVGAGRLEQEVDRVRDRCEHLPCAARPAACRRPGAPRTGRPLRSAQTHRCWWARWTRRRRGRGTRRERKRSTRRFSWASSDSTKVRVGSTGLASSAAVTISACS